MHFIYRPLVSAMSVLALLATGPGPAAAAVTAHPPLHHARKTTARKAAAGKGGRKVAARRTAGKLAKGKTSGGQAGGKAAAGKGGGKAAGGKATARSAAARKAAARKAAARKAAAQRAELAALARFAASAQLADVPAQYLSWYRAAAGTCPGLSGTVLAGIGTIESDNGRSAARRVHSGKNPKGAEGPMQFEPGTFAEYKMRMDQSRKLTPYDPMDAIYSAARMLCADGAGSAGGLRGAIFAYNHACWYVQDVLTIASRYATQARPKPKTRPTSKHQQSEHQQSEHQQSEHRQSEHRRKRTPHAKKEKTKAARARKKRPARRRGGQGGSQPAGAC